MLGENISSVGLMTGTSEELLDKELEPAQRFIITQVHNVLENYKNYLRENPVVHGSKFMDITLKLISNIAVNTMVPFILTIEPHARELVIKETLFILSNMIQAGFTTIKAEDESKEESSH